MWRCNSKLLVPRPFESADYSIAYWRISKWSLHVILEFHILRRIMLSPYRQIEMIEKLGNKEGMSEGLFSTFLCNSLRYLMYIQSSHRISCSSMLYLLNIRTYAKLASFRWSLIDWLKRRGLGCRFPHFFHLSRKPII